MKHENKIFISIFLPMESTILDTHSDGFDYSNWFRLLEDLIGGKTLK